MRRRSPPRWATPFGSFVSDFGVGRIVLSLAASGNPVTNRAVYAWVGGFTRPRPDRAIAMVQISGGRLTLDDVYRQGMEIRNGRDSDDSGTT